MLTRRSVLSGFLATCLPVNVAAQGGAPALRDDGWPVGAPALAGFDPAALNELVGMIDAGVTVPNVHALLIEHKGRLVFEHYWPGEARHVSGRSLGVVQHGPTTLHDIRSVSKSVTSLLLGIALGGADTETLARPITSFFPDRADPGGRLNGVTLHHVLTMTAGLAWNELIVPYEARNDFVRLYTSGDPVGFVLSKELRNRPGDRWTYNSGLTDLVAGVIETLTGKPFDEYAGAALFGPLGITDYDWHRPAHWPPDGFPMASAGLRLRARDLAKIGSLILHDGQWQGRQIVPASWITASTAYHVENLFGRYGYGYFWYPGTLLSGHRVIQASGYGDQRVFVLPEVGLGITLFAGNYDTGGGEIDARITGRIIRALR